MGATSLSVVVAAAVVDAIVGLLVSLGEMRVEG